MNYPTKPENTQKNLLVGKPFLVGGKKISYTTETPLKSTQLMAAPMEHLDVNQ